MGLQRAAEMNITEARQTVSSDATMRTLSELPGPKGLPLLGNLLQLDLKQLHRVLERWGHEFGTLYRFELGRRPVVVITDPEINQTILRNRPKLYRRLDTIETVFREMGITCWALVRDAGRATRDNNRLRVSAVNK
jgi:hypothetical protein